jgi:hypothetical protein
VISAKQIRKLLHNFQQKYRHEKRVVAGYMDPFSMVMQRYCDWGLVGRVWVIMPSHHDGDLSAFHLWQLGGSIEKYLNTFLPAIYNLES